jgi:hypothetical protein
LEIRLVSRRIDVIVEASEGIESCKLGPLSAELAVSLVTEESADVCSNMRDAEHIEVHNSSD